MRGRSPLRLSGEPLSSSMISPTPPMPPEDALQRTAQAGGGRFRISLLGVMRAHPRFRVNSTGDYERWVCITLLFSYAVLLAAAVGTGLLMPAIHLLWDIATGRSSSSFDTRSVGVLGLMLLFGVPGLCAFYWRRLRGRSFPVPARLMWTASAVARLPGCCVARTCRMGPASLGARLSSIAVPLRKRAFYHLLAITDPSHDPNP